jgi:hypothetical protein
MNKAPGGDNGPGERMFPGPVPQHTIHPLD